MKQNNLLFRFLMVITFFLTITNAVPGQEKTDYSPKFSGYIRAWHQTEFSTNQGQFLVKQARLGINGAVNKYAAYKVLVDFTRLGKLQTVKSKMDSVEVITNVSAGFSDILLDAAAILTPVSNFEVTAGQFKVPYSTENLRSDQVGDFSNRPLHTLIAPALRDIGVMAGYKIQGGISAEFLAGVFNGAGLNKIENDKSQDFALRAVVSPLSGLSFSGNYYTTKKTEGDIKYINFGADFRLGAFFIDGEYNKKMTETVSKNSDANSIFGYVTYNIPIETEFLKEITPGFRYEKFDANTSVDKDEIDMMTFGLTFEFAKVSYARFRINYELFDYKNGAVNPNRLIIEYQVRF